MYVSPLPLGSRAPRVANLSPFLFFLYSLLAANFFFLLFSLPFLPSSFSLLPFFVRACLSLSLSLTRSLSLAYLRELGTPFWVAWHRAPAWYTREFSHRNRSLGCVGLRSGGIRIGCPANITKKRRILEPNLKIYTEVTTIARRLPQMYIYLVKKLAYSMNRYLKHIISAE